MPSKTVRILPFQMVRHNDKNKIAEKGYILLFFQPRKCQIPQRPILSSTREIMRAR